MFKESPSLGTTALSTKCVSTKSAKTLQSCHVGSLKYKMQTKKSALAGRFLTTEPPGKDIPMQRLLRFPTSQCEESLRDGGER